MTAATGTFETWVRKRPAWAVIARKEFADHLLSVRFIALLAIMGLVASVARTPEGAGNLGSIIAVILGMLGGTFFPLGRGDDLVAKLSYLTPHAWFLQGLGDLANGAHWTAALPAVLAMTVFALVFGILAWVLLRRRMRG